jgi:DEAD/DEAH box helicase domain-containing protein
MGWDNFVIIDEATGEALAELDWHSAPRMLHEQAIYQHDARQYQVERLDHENHKAYVRAVEPDYFTTALTHVKVKVLDSEASGALVPMARGSTAPTGGVTASWGEVAITEKVVGYKKVKFHTHENAGYGDVRLPEVDMHTTAFWLTLPAAGAAELGHAVAVEAMRGLSHALELVATLALMCDPRDLGRAIEDGSSGESQSFAVTAYLYDAVPGGVGLSERIHERASDLVLQAAELIAACPCPLGCPCCVGATAAAAAPERPRAGMDRKGAVVQLLGQLSLTSSRSIEPARAACPT